MAKVATVSIQEGLALVGAVGGACTIRGTVEELCPGERLEDGAVARSSRETTRSVRFGVRDATGLAIVDDDWLVVVGGTEAAVSAGDIVTVSGRARRARAEDRDEEHGTARAERDALGNSRGAWPLALLFDGGRGGAVSVSVESRGTTDLRVR